MINALWKCSGKQIKASFPVKTLSGADKSFPRANSNFSNALLEDADYS